MKIVFNKTLLSTKIAIFCNFRIASFDGDRDYYSLNTVDHDYGDDVFHDVVDEYAYVHAQVRDYIDGEISDEDDEVQDAYLCELEYQLNN